MKLNFGGIPLFLCAILAFACMNALAKGMALQYPIIMVVWARYLSQTVLTALVFNKNLKTISKVEIGLKVSSQFIGDEIPFSRLEQIIEETIDFDIPLINISDQIASLELFHGPTWAFKDVGARFMARCLAYAHELKEKQNLTILVATSGDTGGAVADGFFKVEGIDVVILYPKGKVSEVQEKQLTTLGENITALEVDGTFDDCQNMVKSAFIDPEITENVELTSANSINIARWLAQMFYYLSLIHI